MLKTILSISGKPGLYKLSSQGKNMIIVESLVDGKKVPAYAHDKIISLGDIAMFTEEEEVPLYSVLESVKQKYNGETVKIDKKANNKEYFDFFAEILPTFDRDRVYATDIKKLISWYNLLVTKGHTDFLPKKDENEAEAKEEAQ